MGIGLTLRILAAHGKSLREGDGSSGRCSWAL